MTTFQTPEAGLALGILLSIAGCLFQFVVHRLERKRLESELAASKGDFADLLTVALHVTEDNIGLAYDLEAATDRVSMALDVELLAKPGTTVTADGVVPAQRSPYDYEKGGL